MNPHRSAFGASGETPLAFVPSMPAQAGMEPRHSPSHSGGQRLRTGGAGSAAFAWVLPLLAAWVATRVADSAVDN
jgi:hypothetical protein